MTDRTLTPAELEQLAHALHRGDELTYAERHLYYRCDDDRTGATGGDLIEAMDRLEASATPCRWCGGRLDSTDRDSVHDLCRMTADDADDASADELETAAEMYDAHHRNTRKPDETAHYRAT